ncbi:DNA repair protein RecO [Paraferrimonas sedimenticola]|uniref:DNA repair protein RecO n=1 Tax=Paraferrimonas sedimenticola TaxID=375674 RepID=A0AA37RYU9_9GAMM|nr:DNA repair protein RecO [Paraferrimonas sedimenticola]GLP97187.1 DNA repair protein RecO [Paraferrimonas sedimenticola]
MQRAYLLHSRPYQEHKLLIELLTESQGRIGAVVRVGTSKAQRLKRALLQPFQPLQIELSGRSQLKTLSRVEAAAPALPLVGKPQYAGLYLNELCVRLLAEGDPVPCVFDGYHQSLLGLAKAEPMEPTLRYFEWLLLDALGAAPSLQFDTQGGEIEAKGRYQLVPQQGFEASQLNEPGANYSGQTLESLSARQLTPEQWRESKHLLRQLLSPLLGDKPLTSRALFQPRKGDSSD